MIKILVLGGTQFIGRDLVETLMTDENYSLSLANRGISNPNLFNNLYKLNIDRNNKETCSKLISDEYDIVIDLSCYTETQFTNTIPYLRYKKYIYISSMSVLHNLESLSRNSIADESYYHYCVNKIATEKYVVENIKNCTIIRPPAIYGENDNTGRFYQKNGGFYWRINNEIVRSTYNQTIHVKEVTEAIKKYLSLKDNDSDPLIVHL